MEADGFLMLGAVETVVGLTDIFRPFPDKRGLYRPSGVRRRNEVLKVAALQLRRLLRSGGDRRIFARPVAPEAGFRPCPISAGRPDDPQLSH